MCKFYNIINKYVSQYNYDDVIDFLRCNNINYLNFIKNKKIPLKHKNNLYGGNLSGKNDFTLTSKYSVLIDEYNDTLDDNKKYINFIKLNATKDERGDYKEDDHCAVLIIDTIKNKATIQSLNNYKDCLKCKIGNEDFKIGDILMHIILSLCKKENIKKIILTDTSYFLCGNDKITLMYLRTLTKGEPYYCKFGFTPKYEDDIKVWNYNKKKFIE